MAMISFGFTLYKVIQGLESGVTNLPIDLEPARAGLVLTGLGILSLIIGIIEYYMVMRQIRTLTRVPYWGHTLWIALLMLSIAVAIFFGIMVGAL